MAFNAPVTAIDLQQLRGCFVCWTAVSDAVGEIDTVLTGFLVQGFAFDEEGLLHAGKAQVRVECGGGPDAAGFNTAVAAVGGGELWRTALCKDECDIGFEGRLIVFDGKVVIRAVVDQVLCECVLRV